MSTNSRHLLGVGENIVMRRAKVQLRLGKVAAAPKANTIF